MNNVFKEFKHKSQKPEDPWEMSLDAQCTYAKLFTPPLYCMAASLDCYTSKGDPIKNKNR